MEPNVRAAVAAAGLAHAGGRKLTSVYDYSSSRYQMIDARFDGAILHAYDYGDRCYFDGTLPSLYHYGQRSYIDFKIVGGGRYEGYDYGARCYWEIRTDGHRAELYDYGERRYFSYSR